MLKIIPTYSLADIDCTQTGRAIYAALKDLEDGNLDTRLPPFKTV